MLAQALLGAACLLAAYESFKYLKGVAGPDNDAFRTVFHVIAVQRNLRILGIFIKLARQDGKPNYLSLIPRVWQHLQTDLATPFLRNLEPLVLRAFDWNADR